MQLPSYAAYRDAFRGMRMPFAFVDLDMFDENIREIAKRAAGKPIRVASKSVRVLDLLKRVLENPAFQGVMTFTADETIWLCENGLDDLLLAYPCWNPDDLAGICRTIAKGKRIVVMLDCADHARHYDAIAKKSGVILPVCIDLDLSTQFPGLHFGVNRSPVDCPEKALALWKVIEPLKNLSLEGLMGYEAQIAGVGDYVPGMGIKAPVVRMLKRQSISKVRQRRLDTVEALRSAGAPLTLVNGGGTGSIESTILEEIVTEVTVGSGLFSSHLFDYYSRFKHLPAAGYAVEITRMPKPGIYTCLGGGYVASGSLGIEKLPIPYLPVGCKLLPNEAAGEVQTPVSYSGMEQLQLGDPVFFRHSKAGELCERFDSVHLLEGGKLSGSMKTYRGEGKTFL